MKRINIMTSCDDNLTKYIFPQLVSINENLSGYEVHFFLAYSRISSENLQLLNEFTKTQTNIHFHEIKVENLPFYESFVIDGGRQWPHEAYFTLRVQDYLPDDVDRVLYIDAGDVIIDGDIGPYYFDDFEGNSLIATPLSFKQNPVNGEAELYTSDDILKLAKDSLFNSGSYVINVDKFRNEGYTEDDYLYLKKALADNANPGDIAFFGDQGFLAAAFVGDVKFYGYPEQKDPSYMPYNFRSSYWGVFKRELDYEPVILHYAIVAKPWIVRFSEEAIDNVIGDPMFIGKNMIAPVPTIVYMTPEHLKLCEIWWKYAKDTPIYEEVNIRAEITAENWLKYYLPMCVKYNEMYYKYAMLSKQMN